MTPQQTTQQQPAIEPDAYCHACGHPLYRRPTPGEVCRCGNCGATFKQGAWGMQLPTKGR